MTWTSFFWVLFVSSGQFILLPLLGAGILRACFRMIGIREYTFYQTWKVYLAAVASGMLLIACVNLIVPFHKLDWREAAALQIGLPCLAQLVVVALMLRKFSRHTLLAEGAGVLVTNLVAVTVMIAVSAAG
jgi:hypothetical protein